MGISQHAFGNPFVPAKVYEDSGLGVELGQEGFEHIPNELNQRFCPKRTGESIVLFPEGGGALFPPKRPEWSLDLGLDSE